VRGRKCSPSDDYPIACRPDSILEGWRLGHMVQMNDFFKNLLLRKKGPAPPPLGSSVGAAIRRAGIVFVLLTDSSDNLGADLAGCVQVASQHNASVIDMLGGLLQFLIEGESEQTLQDECKYLAEDIVSLIRNRGITVWTVQQCSIGCWGNDEWLNYGVIVPNFQHVMRILGSAKPGDCFAV